MGSKELLLGVVGRPVWYATHERLLPVHAPDHDRDDDQRCDGRKNLDESLLQDRRHIFSFLVVLIIHLTLLFSMDYRCFVFVCYGVGICALA